MVGEKSSTKEMRAHELTLIMRYGWLDLDEMMILDCIPSLHLLPSCPFPTFNFSLKFFLTLVPLEREGDGEKWESEMGWFL